MFRTLNEIRYAPCALSRHVCGHAGSVCQSHWDATAPTRLSGADPLLTSQLHRYLETPWHQDATLHVSRKPPSGMLVLPRDQCFIVFFSQNGQQLVCSIKCCNLTQPIDTKRPHHSHQNGFGKMFLWSSNTQDGYRACINSLQYIKGAYCPTYLIFSNI